MAELAEGYVLAIQWILHYYYHGVQSWSWWVEKVLLLSDHNLLLGMIWTRVGLELDHQT